MNDEELDERLRTWATEALRDAPQVTRPARPAHGGTRPRVLAMVAAAALVLGLVGAGVLVARRAERSSIAAGLSPGSTPTAPAGFRPVTVHGLTIDVPAAWPTDKVQCGTPVADTVVLPLAAVDMCAARRITGITTVQFQGETVPNPGATRMIISGRAAERRNQFEDGVHSTTITVASLAVSVVINAPARAEVDRLVDTLRVSDVDANGCPARITGFGTLATGKRPQRSGAADAVIPPTPSRLIICGFSNGWVERSASARSAQVMSIMRSLNAQPRGWSITAPETYLPSACAYSDTYSYRVGALYAAGPPVLVSIRLGLCGRLGASNGTISIQRTDAVINALTSVLGQVLTPYGVVRPA